MPKIRYLRIRFAQNLFPYDIPKFRAAVIEKTEREAPLFHNHKGNEGFHYRYPLIQYKVTHKKASIVCLNAGTDDIHYLLQQRDMNLTIGRTSHTFEVEDVDLHYHNVQIWDMNFEYSLLNWLALSQKSYLEYEQLQGDETAQIELLNRKLTGNIISFAKGIKWDVKERIVTEITKIKGMKMLPFKRKRLLAFSVNFRCNVSLPDFVGLGKGSSVGFGVVKRIFTNNSKENK